MFYGELMFVCCIDVLKIVLVVFCVFFGGQGVVMIDCQQEIEYLVLLGGVLVLCVVFFVYVWEVVNVLVIVLWYFDKLVFCWWIVCNE